MIEADLFCTVGVLFAAFISLGAMSIFWPLELQPGWEWLADLQVLVWIGSGMVFLAWTKIWMDKPSYNTGELRPSSATVSSKMCAFSLQYDGYHYLFSVSGNVRSATAT
jgi:hypothetical protein